jgi:hypothetical protein
MIGIDIFLRCEYAFRSKFDINNNYGFDVIKLLMKFLNDEILTNSQLITLKKKRKDKIKLVDPNNLNKNFVSSDLNSLSKINKNSKIEGRYITPQHLFFNYHNNIPWKNKTYFVDGSIMSEEEFHKYRDNINLK